MTTASISGTQPLFPGMVQWYRVGNYLAVGDQDRFCGVLVQRLGYDA